MHHPVLPHPLHVFSWLFLLTSGYFILGPQPPQLVWAAFLSPSPRAEPAEARPAQGRRCHVPGAEGSAGNSLHMERAALGCPQLSGWPMGSLPSSRPPQTLAAPAPCLAAFGSVASCLPAGPACRVPWMPPCSCQLRGSQRAQCHLPCAGAGGAGEAGTAHPGARGAGGSRTSLILHQQQLQGQLLTFSATGWHARGRLGCTRSTFAQFAAGSSGTSVYFHK